MLNPIHARDRLLQSPGFRALAYGLCAIMGLLALSIRIRLYPVETSDYNVFLSSWYDFIVSHGGFAALRYNFSNYNTPYLMLLAAMTYLPIPKLIAIKTISVVFDGVMALFTFLILRLKWRQPLLPLLGAMVVVLAPTIIINSSAWGQCDAIYTAFCLGSLYLLLKERPAWACIFFGLALSFKLQAIFFGPVLLMLLITRKLPLKYLGWVPAIFLLMLVPAFAAGRDAWSLLTIYVGQATSGNGGGVGTGNGRNFGQFPGRQQGQFPGSTPGQFPGAGQFPGRGAPSFPGGGSGQFHGGAGRAFSSSSFTFNAPSFYQWLPAQAGEYWLWIGIVLAALLVILVGILLFKSKQPLTSTLILKLALVFAIAIPFLLPEMHERYFYLADVLSIIAAFFFPRTFFVAIIMQLCSLLSYAPYMLQTQIVDLRYVAFGVFILMLITLTDLVKTLYPSIWHKIKGAETEHQALSVPKEAPLL